MRSVRRRSSEACASLSIVSGRRLRMLAAAADLRGDHELVAVAAVGHPAPDDRLRAAVLDQVGVGRVDEVAAGGGVGVEDLEGPGFVGRPAEHVAAEADREHVEAGASEGGHPPVLPTCGAILAPRERVVPLGAREPAAGDRARLPLPRRRAHVPAVLAPRVGEGEQVARRRSVNSGTTGRLGTPGSGAPIAW